MDDLLSHLQLKIPNLRKSDLLQLIQKHPSMFSIHPEDQIKLEPLNIEFVESCFKLIFNPMQKRNRKQAKTKEKHTNPDLNSDVGEHEEYVLFITKKAVCIRNFRVHSVLPTGIVLNPTGNQLFQLKWDTSQLKQIGRHSEHIMDTERDIGSGSTYIYVIFWIMDQMIKIWIRF